MIYFLPWGDENTASSRLRVHKVLPFLNAKLGVPDQYEKGDVLIIQKALQYGEMRRAQASGVPVIYDIDDNFLDQQEFATMAQTADLVTVGSSYFHKWFPNAPVIDDCLDWDGTEKKSYTPSKLLGWHGYGNLGYIFEIAPRFTALGYDIRTIVGAAYMEPYMKAGFDTLPWSLETIDKDLAETDLCAFYLPEDDFSQAKGMNKLIKAWAIGLPCYASPTVEYQRVMKEACVDGFLVEDWDAHDFTKPWEPKMREYALTFSPEHIAEQWKKVIETL